MCYLIDELDNFKKTEWNNLSSNIKYNKDRILTDSFFRMEIQPVHPKGDQSWVLTGRTDVEAETLILWHLM